MGILLGLIASFGWGTGDYLVRNTTRRIGSLLSLFYMQIFGLLFIGILAAVTGDLGRLLGQVDLRLLAIFVISAVLSVSGSLMLYKSFEIGMLSLVSPIASSYAAVTLVLSLLSGETLTPARFVGVLVVLAGVVLASIERRGPNPEAVEGDRRYKLPPGVLFAIGAAILYGFGFWVQGFFIVPLVGGLSSVVVYRTGAVMLLCLVMLIGRRNARLPDRRAALVLVGVGVLDTAAFLANSIGLMTEQVSIVIVLSSLFSMWTVLFAWLLLKERPNRIQWTGIALIFSGVALVSLGAG